MNDINNKYKESLILSYVVLRKLFQQRFIEERNEILQSWSHFLKFPRSIKRLREINNYLDEIEIELYKLLKIDEKLKSEMINRCNGA